MNSLLKKIISAYREREKKLNEVSLCKYVGLNRGYILVIVLVISAFLVGLSSDFIYSSKRYLSIITRVKDDANCEFLAYSGFELAKTVLDIDRLGLSKSFMQSLNNNRNVDTNSDIWALDFPPIDVDDGTIKIKIEDENSKINLSAMANQYVERSPYYGVVQRFFYNMGFPIDFADIIIDWIDPDDARFPYGAESSGYYMNLSPPYHAKNQELDSIEELLLMKDMTSGIYYGLYGGNFGMENDLVDHNRGKINITDELISKMSNSKNEVVENSDSNIKIGRERSRRLDEYFRAYGNASDFTDDKNKININTASYRVLSSLSDSMTEDVVEEIIRKRILAPFTSVSEFNSLVGDGNDYSNIAGVKSYIFRITVMTEMRHGKAFLTIFYDRDEKKILYLSIHH